MTRATIPRPPLAPPVKLTRERFGLTWRDDWAWLRDPAYPVAREPAILAYLESENAHTRAMLAPHEALIGRLHAELKGRLTEDDASVPVQDGDFFYQWAFAPGAQYRAWLRRRIDQGVLETILDENALAAGLPYLNLRALAPSPDGRLIAYTVDTDGSERFRLWVKDLTTGVELEHAVANTSGTVVWAEDGCTLLYVELNDQLRPWRVRAHTLGTAQGSDSVVYAEEDPAFFVSIGKTRDDRFLVIGTGTHVTRELRVIPADRPHAPPGIVAARREGHRYALDHAHGAFWIVTNDRHENFRLVRATESDPGEAGWEEVIAGSDDRYLLAASCFADFMVLTERIDGLADVRIRSWAGEEHVVAFAEDVYTAGLGDNREFQTDTVRIGYSSMITPPSVIDYVVPTRELIVRKVQAIPSGYDRTLYRTQRVMAPAPDGERVPVTLVWRDGFVRDGNGPVFMYGYGAYGSGNDPTFNLHRLSLLDRGFCFALAHVRGGDELGWRWYRQGKLTDKENSFTDFIAIAEHLIKERWTRAGNIAIRGGSAGGLLVGAVLNMHPELWRCAIADVPFVDIVNTMSDPSLPLTPIEWPEWGNPLEDQQALALMLRYSPYDNVRPQAYPAMFVTAGIADPRVTYWEPAKWVARLRATGTGASPLLLKTNMEAGHFGKSGRYDALLDLAEQYAFLFDVFGMADHRAAPSRQKAIGPPSSDHDTRSSTAGACVTRRRISSGSTFERDIGYSRAVVEDGWVLVSGTTGFDYRAMTIAPDILAQCRQCLANIEAALAEAGCGVEDVVRVRYLLPDAADFAPCWPLLREAFGRAAPAATMMVVGLADPRMRIEIEVTARLPACD